MNIFKKTYLRNIMFLFSGTMLAQAIPILITPLLTRIYSPTDFGIYALYSAIVTVVYVFMTGRYELAILDPEEDKKANNIVLLSFMISLLLNLGLIILLIIFGELLVSIPGFEELNIYIYLIPISLLAMTIQQVSMMILNRKKMFKLIAKLQILQTLLIAIFNLLIGFSFNELGLVISYLLGNIITSIIIVIILFKEKLFYLKDTNLKSIKEVFIEYRSFPTMLIPSNLANRMSLQAPVYLFTKLYSISEAGQFSLTHRILKTPITLISTNVSKVFRQKAIEQLNEYGECMKLYIYTLCLLISIGLLPFSLLFIFSENIFVFVFGEEWRLAGELAKYMSPMLFVQFCVVPLSSLFLSKNKQKYDFYWQIILFPLIVSGILSSYFLFDNMIYSVIIYSFILIFMYLVNLFLSYRIATGKKKDNDRRNNY